MHPKSIAQRAVEPTGQNLELVNYGAGYAWLRPTEPAEEDEALYTLTALGRRTLAIARFLDRGLTVAEVFGTEPAARGVA